MKRSQAGIISPLYACVHIYSQQLLCAGYLLLSCLLFCLTLTLPAAVARTQVEIRARLAPPPAAGNETTDRSIRRGFPRKRLADTEYYRACVRTIYAGDRLGALSVWCDAAGRRLLLIPPYGHI